MTKPRLKPERKRLKKQSWDFDTAQTGSSMAVSQEEGGYLTKPKQKSSVVSDAVQKLASLLS